MLGDVDVLTLPALPAGSNNIGDVDVATQPARVATTDNIGAALMTNVIHDGTNARTPKFEFGLSSVRIFILGRAVTPFSYLRERWFMVEEPLFKNGFHFNELQPAKRADWNFKQNPRFD